MRHPAHASNGKMRGGARGVLVCKAVSGYEKGSVVQGMCTRSNVELWICALITLSVVIAVLCTFNWYENTRALCVQQLKIVEVI